MIFSFRVFLSLVLAVNSAPPVFGEAFRGVLSPDGSIPIPVLSSNPRSPVSSAIVILRPASQPVRHVPSPRVLRNSLMEKWGQKISRAVSVPAMLERSRGLARLFDAQTFFRSESSVPSWSRPGSTGSSSVPELRKLKDVIFVVFDLETTGFHAEVNQPAQIGAVKVRLKEDGTLKILDTFEQQINPGAPMPAEITEFTGITNGDLKDQPSIDQVLPKFFKFVGQDSVLVAHNAPFDVSFTAHQMQKSGMPFLSNPILDTREMVKSLFPEIKFRDLESLIHTLKLGGVQEHTAASDSLYGAKVLAHAVQKLGETKNQKVSQLTLQDLEKHTPILHFQAVLQNLRPLSPGPTTPPPGAPDILRMLPQGRREEEMRPPRPLPGNFQQEVTEISGRLHREGKPNQLRDIAHAMEVDYQELREKLREAALGAPISPADGHLEHLREDPGTWWALDLDSTLNDRGPDGLSLSIKEEVLREFCRLLKKGPVILNTGRSLDREPWDAPFSFAAWKPFISRILNVDRSLLKNLFFVGGFGSEMVSFDSRGNPERHLLVDWTREERLKIEEILKQTQSELGMDSNSMAMVLSIPGRIDVKFSQGDPRSEEFARKVREKLGSHGILTPVRLHHDWMHLSRYDKGDGLRFIYMFLRGRGYKLQEKDLRILGDEFSGGDAAMALAFPGAEAYSVGDSPHRILPPNVRRLGIRGSRGALRWMEAINEGLSQRPEPPKPFFSYIAQQRLVFLAAGGALTLAAPWIWGHAAFVGSLILSAIGIPQIIKNFKFKAEATKHQPIGTYRIWFAAAVLLVTGYLLQGSQLPNVWPIVTSAAGMVESGVLITQLHGYSPEVGPKKKSFFVVVGSILFSLAWLFAPLPLSMDKRAEWVGYCALALLPLISWPQIRGNYVMYRTQRATPVGIQPLYPFLLALGSALHLGLNIAHLNVLWGVNSLISMLSGLVVLGQIYSPQWMNNFLLMPFMKLQHRFRIFLRRHRSKDQDAASKIPTASLSERLDKVLKAFSTQDHISGTLGVMTPAGSYLRGVGKANDRLGILNDGQTRYLLASVSKQFVAAAILKLEALGKLKVSDRVSNYIPGYPAENLVGKNGEPVTIQHLLQHTSGIPDAYETAAIQAKLFHRPIEFKDIVEAIKNKPLSFSPGTQFEYSNTGYVLLGEVIRRASGQTFSEFMRRNFFEPLGMTQTTVGQPAGVSNAALSYDRKGQDRADHLEENGIKEIHVTDVFTDGNIYSSAEDLAAWALNLTSGRILSAASTEKMFTPSAVMPYGYGWYIDADSSGRKMYWHPGHWLAYNTRVAVFPEDDAAFVWLSNQALDDEVDERLYSSIIQALFP
ncbi:MAG: serine hydrolase [Elusimicrobia bacterium]|nr:serine hydrolase [Elusimicrobiota bacterium]